MPRLNWSLGTIRRLWLSRSIGLLDGRHGVVADVGQRLQQRGPVVGGEFAADDRPRTPSGGSGQRGVVLALGVGLVAGTDSDQAMNSATVIRTRGCLLAG
ncbi:hypothetical protein [Nonomuraea zeae]|uniref:Uncharacterized protein n=1 Tax=Nonomuraea zeae TaxID=1642303 RepID=A0A5S4G1B8_9ACTN|nr:hypothetical protein [Nonomuraea zeae]TMR26284.1 hypothetical protein ETD85_43065 [Nonomuraea zeae]